MQAGESGVSEPLRKQYLRAMGIQVWTPRIDLPGAKQPPVTADTVVERDSQPSPVTEEAISPAVQPDERPSAKTQTQQEKTSRNNPEFRLVSLLYPGQCMVVSDVSLHSQPQLSDQQSQLLSALLHSLGVTDRDAVQPTFFSWPLLQSLQIDQSRHGAIEAVQAFFSAQTGRQSLRFVLIMGETAGRYILPHEAELAEPRGKLWSIKEYPALITQSIDAMLAEPLCKREVWRDVQPLLRLNLHST